MMLVLIFVMLGLAAGTGPRPDVDEVPEFARWLVSHCKFGVLSISNVGPFGYVASYSDARTGSPYFFLSRLDPAGLGALKDPRASFTLSERFFGDCGGADPQSPKCAKINLKGQLRKLPDDSEEGVVAKGALFYDHPAFAGFPKQNGTFAVFKLDIEEIFLVNKAAPSRNLTVEDYLAQS